MISKHNPAFPTPGFDHEEIPGFEGLSKREYAAIKILSGLIAGYDKDSKVNGRLIPETDYQELCSSAVQLTDTLFESLSKGTQTSDLPDF